MIFLNPYSSIKVAQQLKIGRLSGGRTFRDLDIAIETERGDYRHWYDKHNGQHGQTKMLYPYGYIKSTKGMDGEAIDCFIGPNINAASVYVITTSRPPDFNSVDEQKCMLGFSSERDARTAFSAHYTDPKFLREIRTFPYATFLDKVYKSTKIAALSSLRRNAGRDHKNDADF